MSTVALRTIRALRDEVIHAHQLALDSGDAGRLARRLFKTSGSVGNYYAKRFKGVYDSNLTARYIQRMAQGQIRELLADGVTSASRATNFGTREFARQNPGRRWVFVWRHFPSNRSRPSHVDAAGLTVPASQDFGIVPPMGSPYCGCLAELQEERVAPRRSR